VNSSLTITGPGHDGVIQETIINPDSNEAVISVPAHGNNMAQEVVLQGRGGSNEVSSPLLAYIREGACYVADLPDDINPSDNLRESRQASIDSAETEDLYYIHDEFSQIEEGSSEYNELSNTIKSKCAGVKIFRVNSKQLSEEAWQQQKEENFNLDANFRMSLRKKRDAEVSKRQSDCEISQWYGCTQNTVDENGNAGSCFYWTMLDEASGTLTPTKHVNSGVSICLSCTRFCPDNPPPSDFECDCDQITTMEKFAACYRKNWFSCPPQYRECPGSPPVCIKASRPCPSILY